MIKEQASGTYAVLVYDPKSGNKAWIRPADYEMDPPKTKREARRLERKAIERMEHRKPGLKDETCDEFAKRWVDDFPHSRFGVERSRQTQAHNRERVRKFIKDFQGRPLRSISRSDAHQWAMANQGSLMVVKSMFYDAMHVELVESNPFAQQAVKRSRGRKDITVVTQEELDVLCGLALDLHGEEFGQEINALITWAAYTCMRPSEIFVASYMYLNDDLYDVREQYNQKLNEITAPKKTSIGKIFVPKQARKAVLSKPRLLTDDLIFHTKTGKQFTQPHLYNAWNPIRHAFIAQLPKDHKMRSLIKRKPDYNFDFYELRHHGASHMLNQLDLAPWKIAKQLRHSDHGELVLSLYGHADDDVAMEDIREAYKNEPKRKHRAVDREARMSDGA